MPALILLIVCLLAGCGGRNSESPTRATDTITEGSWRGLSMQVRKDLSRGVNLAGWFTHRDDPTLRDGWPQGADFALMRKLGVRHVRVLSDPAWLDDHAENPPLLLAAVQEAIDAGLLVVLAMQPSAESKQLMARSDEPVQRLAASWRQLASLFKDVPSTRLLLEVLNEPEVESITRAMEIQRQLIESVRSITPERVVVVGGAHFSDVSDLVALTPLNLPRVIYSFHFYEPHNFTHQGASWGWPMWMVLRGLPYPSTPQNLAALVPQLTPMARPHAAWYGEQSWNREKLASHIDQAAAWSSRHQVPVWCSEFGVLRDVAPADSRRRWLRDARELFESRGIAWTHFDWWGHFGLVTGPADNRRLDEDARVGLGLDPP